MFNAGQDGVPSHMRTVEAVGWAFSSVRTGKMKN